MSRFLEKKLLVLEANLDDMNPEWFGPLSERLFEAGVRDVTLIPAVMKKSRPAVLLQVLVEAKLQEKILGIIFEETTTLGVRSIPVTRFELRRKIKKVKTRYGVVAVKLGYDSRGRLLNASPEYESCREAAKRKKVPLKLVYGAAMRGVYQCLRIRLLQ